MELAIDKTNSASNKIKVLFIITGLGTGAAEVMLYNLLSNLNCTRFEPTVISLMDKGIRDNVYLLGQRGDIPQITPALDILASSSAYGEAFPLVIGEAMSCGVPCVERYYLVRWAKVLLNPSFPGN